MSREIDFIIAKQTGWAERNLLNANIRQGRSADPFLLANGFFEMSHARDVFPIKSITKVLTLLNLPVLATFGDFSNLLSQIKLRLQKWSG